MKFIAILKQEGGCDYTIGCGIKVITIQAQDSNQAAQELKKTIKEEYSSSEFKLSELMFFSVKDQYLIDLNHWYGQFEIEKAQELQKKIKEKELAELERLKKKYENS